MTNNHTKGLMMKDKVKQAALTAFIFALLVYPFLALTWLKMWSEGCV